MTMMERDYPKMAAEDKPLITKQIRAGYLFLSGVLFEPPMEFWDIAADFIPASTLYHLMGAAAELDPP